MNLQPVDFKAVAAKGAYVYCYLREDGSPYYIGIASNADRPFRTKHRHVQNCIRPIPDRPELIRVMRSGLTWQEAGQWEKFYIAHYGRKDMGTGILRNRTAGGDGCVDPGPKALSKMRSAFKKANAVVSANHHERSAARYGVSVEFWSSLTKEERQKICMRHRAGICGPEIFNNNRHFGREKLGEAKEIESAAKYGCSLEQWKTISASDRSAICTRFGRGLRGAALFQPVLSKEEVAAQKYGVLVNDWSALSDKERRAFRMWWKRNGGGTLDQWLGRRRSFAAA